MNPVRNYATIRFVTGIIFFMNAIKISNGVNHQKSELYFFTYSPRGYFCPCLFIFKPFLYALILAIIFATVFTPLHRKMLAMTQDRKGLAALLATISVLIIVIMPLTFLGIQIFQEATGLYSSLVENGDATNLSRVMGDTIQGLTRFSPVPINPPTSTSI